MSLKGGNIFEHYEWKKEESKVCSYFSIAQIGSLLRIHACHCLISSGFFFFLRDLKENSVSYTWWCLIMDEIWCITLYVNTWRKCVSEWIKSIYSINRWNFNLLSKKYQKKITPFYILGSILLISFFRDRN